MVGYQTRYTKEAYEAKKFAFVSDYARFWVLYKYGGIYFDTDVEVIKPMDDIIGHGSFMGCENECGKGIALKVNPGLGLGANPGHKFYKEMLDVYGTMTFLLPNGMYNQTTVVKYTSKVLVKYGLKNQNNIQEVSGITIYPKEYFCPYNYVTKRLEITEQTRAIHHYMASWKSGWEKRMLHLWVPLTYKCPWLADSVKKLYSMVFSMCHSHFYCK